MLPTILHLNIVPIAGTCHFLHISFTFLFLGFCWQSMPRNIYTVNAGSLSVKKSPQWFHYFIAYGAFFLRTSPNRLSHSGSASKTVPKWNVHTFFAATKQVNTQLGSGVMKASCRRLCCLTVVIARFCLFVVRNDRVQAVLCYQLCQWQKGKKK